MTSSVDWSAKTRPHIDEFRREVARLGPDGKDWEDKLKEVNEANAYTIAADARAKARALGGVQARAADAIKSRRVKAGIRVAVSSGAGRPEALAAFWGGKRRTGWNSPDDVTNPGFISDTPNLPEWVGNTWKVAERGEGPYAVNAAIADKRADVIKAWGDAIDDLAREAGFR